MKYNLALIPVSKSNAVITLAKQLSNIAYEYLLSNRSLPHVTLYQFQAEEKEIEGIWNQVSDIYENQQPLFLTFNQFSYITFDNNIFWVSLLPNNCNVLHEMHSQIANILNLPVKKTFDPHMTLINTKNKEYKNIAGLVSESYKVITDRFTLSLGVSDDIGQFTNVIYHDDIKKNISSKL